VVIFNGSNVHIAGVHVTVGGKEARVTLFRTVDAALRIEDDLYGRPHLRQLVAKNFADFFVCLDVEEISRL
jgi:hypothetical protein